MICVLVVNMTAAVSVPVHKVSVLYSCMMIVGQTWTAFADTKEAIAVELLVNKESGLH